MYERIICIDNKSDFFSISNEIKSKDIVLAINQDVIELCEEKSIPCVDIEKLFHSSEFFESYELFTDLVWKIERSIKIRLQKTLNNGSDEVFEWFSYPLKQLIDQIIFNKRLLEKSLSYYSINKIVVREDVNLNFTNYLLVDANVSLLSLVAKDVAHNNGTIIDKTYTYTANSNNRDNSYFSFGQVEGSILKFKATNQYRYIKPKLIMLRSFLRLLKFLFSLSFLFFIKIFSINKNFFLSVGCRDLDSISSHFKSHNVKVLKLNTEHYLRVNAKKSVKFGRKIINDDFIYENFNFRDYLVQFTGLVLLNTKRLLYKKRFALRIFSYLKPSCIFVQTLTSFNVNSMIMNSIANDINVEVYCWMHGGYGGYSSLAGFDVTDYRFTKNHIVYGEAAKDSITSKKSILKLIYPDVDFNVLILGAPYIESLYSEKETLQKSKKKIVFSLPGVFNPNNFYFGYNRPHAYLNWWNQLKKVIIALSKYEDNFDIVIKDYSYSPQKYRIEKLLKKLGKNKMLYLSSEQSYKDTILDADILIYPWVSTSFIEGLQTKAEILIFDDSDMIPKTETMLNNCPVFETSVDQFIIEMHNYLHNFELLSTNNDMTIGDINTMKNYFIEPIPVNLIVNKLINSCNN
jgi:hypothetical protein